MSVKSDIEMARLAIAKVTRDEIRLKYSLAADLEINEVLPRRLMAFDEAVQQGTLPEFSIESIKLLTNDSSN